MAKSLENRLNELTHEITEIKKQIILHKPVRVEAVRSRIRQWRALGRKVSIKWKGPSAVEEIRHQREKAW